MLFNLFGNAFTKKNTNLIKRINDLENRIIWSEACIQDLIIKYDSLQKELEEMAKLIAAKRNKLPKSDFGMPGERKYPMPDKAHAKNAKARASEIEHKGKISPATKAKIDAKANRKLGKAKKAPKMK